MASQKHGSYHFSHAGLESLSIEFGSACLVYILVSQTHKPTGNKRKNTHTHFTGLTLYIKLYSAVFCDSTVVICASGELLNY